MFYIAFLKTKVGHVYICNLKIMDGITCKPGLYCTAPICLLYVNNKKQLLVPIAIQLNQKPGLIITSFALLIIGQTGFWPRFTTRVRVPRYGCMTLQELFDDMQLNNGFHFLLRLRYTLNAMPCSYGSIFYGNLPDAHPVHKLLKPHFRYTMAIKKRPEICLFVMVGALTRYLSLVVKDANS